MRALFLHQFMNFPAHFDVIWHKEFDAVLQRRLIIKWQYLERSRTYLALGGLWSTFRVGQGSRLQTVVSVGSQQARERSSLSRYCRHAAIRDLAMHSHRVCAPLLLPQLHCLSDTSCHHSTTVHVCQIPVHYARCH